MISKKVEQAMVDAAEFLQKKHKHFDWVGFYIMNNEAKTLHLGPYLGAATEHTVIPYGKGICGQVAVSGQMYHASDVGQEDNYIACSIETKSELVLPIYDARGKLVAQLDIDSHEKNTFTPEVIESCEKVCAQIGKLWGV
ncbi:MAG: GAF domain-containing protein [Cryomorphaceae bacterium]|nr:GAF domain-containing protein [Cryomorphaceae bacterium]